MTETKRNLHVHDFKPTRSEFLHMVGGDNDMKAYRCTICGVFRFVWNDEELV